MSKIEVRTIEASELRASVGNEPTVLGYAALFNSQSKDLGGYRETIQPGAFTRALAEKQPVACLYNHDGNRILGSTKNGTLVLKQDAKGLRFECKVNPADPEAMAVHARVMRGDADACSFAFTVPDGGDSWNANASQRTLKDINLHDVSVLSKSPAYEGTSVNARAEADAWAVKARTRLDNVMADSERRSRLHAVEMQILKERK